MKLCITGTPGTGKTKISKLLSKKLGWKLIELNKLAKEKKLYSGFDKKRSCKIIDMEKLNREIKKLKGNFIFESHYSQKAGCDKIILLTADPKELKARLERRKWKKQKIKENMEAEIMEVIKSEVYDVFPKKNILEIDTTALTAIDTTARIVKFLGSSNGKVYIN